MDNPKFLQTLPSVPQGKKSPPVENYCPQLLYTWPAVTHFDQRAKEDREAKEVRQSLSNLAVVPLSGRKAESERPQQSANLA